MTQPYVGEIRMFGGNFAPPNWAFCNGQQLSISQYQVLFTVIGTTYGGNGQTTFNLPNLQGRLGVGMGQGGGLSNYVLGQTAGTETVTLTTA
jgi:microcystin-dependent protein